MQANLARFRLKRAGESALGASNRNYAGTLSKQDPKTRKYQNTRKGPKIFAYLSLNQNFKLFVIKMPKIYFCLLKIPA